MTTYDVRPARARDLPQLAAIEGSAAEDMVLVMGDPIAGFVRVAFHEGHAHLEQVVVEGVDESSECVTALVEAACERLSVQRHGLITVLSEPDAQPRFERLGFVEVPTDDPRSDWQLRLIEEQPGRVLMRRPLRRHRTVEELQDFLPTLDAAPRDEGTLRLLVRRPATGQREVLDEGELDPAVGLVGDNWSERSSSRTADGGAHPDMQLNVMSYPLVEFLAQDPEREQLAGDQLFLDLDLSADNLPDWTRLVIGDPATRGAVIEVTDQPHTGCAKFIARYGREALGFVNGPEGKPRRMRGLCARVVVPGIIRPGDAVRVERPSPGNPV